MTMPPPLTEKLFASLPAAAQLYIRQLEAFAAHLSEQVAILNDRIAQLEVRLGQDSWNSSRPPSSDGPQVKRGVPRPPSGRHRGGQKGYPRQERVIIPSEAIVDHKPSRCGQYDTPLSGEDPDQVIELSPVFQHVIHHRRHTLAYTHRRPRPSPRRSTDSVPGSRPP